MLYTGVDFEINARGFRRLKLKNEFEVVKKIKIKKFTNVCEIFNY